MKTPEAIPKGTMCITCVHATHHCGDLDFSKMPIIDRTKDMVPIVRCIWYKRDDKFMRSLEAARK